MRESSKDLMTFILLGNFNNLFITWFLLYPYLGSYLKLQNQNLRFNQFYFGFIFMYLGIVIGSRVMPKVMPRLGMRKMFIIISIEYFFNYVAMLFVQYPVLIFANAMLAGFNYQLIQLASLTYFKIKYPLDYNKYFGLISLGIASAIIFAQILLKLIINPNNEQMDLLDLGEPMFPPSVSMNVPKYILLQATLTMTSILFISFRIDPEIGKKIEAHETEMQNTLKEDLLKETKIVAEKPFNWKEQIGTEKFIFLFLVTVTRSCSTEYLATNYHYIGNVLLKNDSLSSSFFAVATITNIAARVTSGYFWERMGFIKCMIFAYTMAISLDLMFIFWAENSVVGFFFITQIVRFTNVYNVLFGPMACFALYELKTALYISQFFEFNNICKQVICNLFQWALLGDSKFGRVFAGFCIMEVIFLGLFLYRKDKIDFRPT